jgi:hypothetical protein
VGKKIAALRDQEVDDDDSVPVKTLAKTVSGLFSRFMNSLSAPSLAESSESSSSECSDSDSDDTEDMASLIRERKRLVREFRASFHELPARKKDAILSFLTIINQEIVRAKAMFLAYSDPFEKYRALLFEYAHTLGHGVEAFANGLYFKAKEQGVIIPTEAFRLHGQCVGMAVLWAGEMSKNLGKLEGEGYKLHQSFPYLFNRAGGFSFGPLRELCDEVGISKEEFCETVLQVVRRDNKRGYCNCSDPNKSVDQLVTCRPGKMLRSDDPNAEVRYLVEVDEDWQRDVLAKAFDGYFDKVADLRNGELTFVDRYQESPSLEARSRDVAAYIRNGVLAAYTEDLNTL